MVLLQVMVAQGQRQNNWWFFNNAAVNFNSGNPVAVAGSAMNTMEGCASVADRYSGNLLFYSNGLNIWNRNHQIMPNGSGLKGGTAARTSSTNAALIVPRPSHPNQYYVFTADEDANSRQVHYNIVDMTLEGGLGNVVAGQKNRLFNSNSSEKLAYAINHDRTAFWLITHSPTGNTWKSYRIDANGIDTNAVVSVVGLSLIKPSGYLKFNPDFSKIANVEIYGRVEVLSFNRQTGTISNPTTFQVPLGNALYGIEFSPSGRYLYTCNITQAIYQIDLWNPTLPPKVVALAPAMGLQMGPDCKIYATNGGLGVINAPDADAPNCNYNPSAVTLAPNTRSNYGLPMSVHFLDQIPPPTLVISDSCAQDTTQLQLNGLGVYRNLRWHFGTATNNTQLTAQNTPVKHQFTQPGKYSIEVIFEVECRLDTIRDTITIVNCALGPNPCYATLSIKDTCLENGTNFLIQSDSLLLNVQWNFGDGTGSNNFSTFHQFLQPGTYRIEALVQLACGKDTLDTVIHIIPCEPDSGICQWQLPNVMTPNEDGLNDHFRLSDNHCEFTRFLLILFNRWGQEIYRSQDPGFK